MAKRRKRKSTKSRGASRKACVVQSGPKKGKLKKGWRYNKRGQCTKARGKR